MLNDSYEVANWARLSPARRDAHNRRRVAHGMDAIPEPAICLYVPPKLSVPDMRRFNIPILVDPAGAVLDNNYVPNELIPPELRADEGGTRRVA